METVVYLIRHSVRFNNKEMIEILIKKFCI